ncbi:MAG: hypothetical protein LBU76_06950 [Azoarcus sp.]|jgi:hypothetical protein|nr:hypothetical protein [Azoarcus sp.]
MSGKKENGVILYQNENGITRVSVRFDEDDLWLTQKQIAEIYDTTQQNVSQHIDGIFKDEELSTEATHKKFLLVQTEGSRQVSHAQAVEKAENEFEIYRAREMKQLESDFDRAVKALADARKEGSEE